MRILGIDFETTGLEVATDRVIEIGAVVWDTESNKPLTVYSELVKPEGFIGVPEEVIRITGIDEQSIYDFGVSPEEAFSKLLKLIESVDCLVAHNAAFDRGFLDAELARLEKPPVAKPWICTLDDVPYPAEVVTRKLDYLAAEHKVLNPFSHRAAFDVLTMLSVLKNYSINEVIERAQSPSVKVTAIVSFEEKDKAKNLGFRWDGKNKKWFKSYKQCDMQVVEFPFEIKVEENQL